MILNHKQLLNLPVYTESSDYLGRIINFEFNPETHQILVYLVGSSSWVKTILGEKIPELKIASAQVISISEEKMIVEDNVLKEKTKKEEISLKISKESPVPAASLRDL